MDDERFTILYRLIIELSPPRGKRCQYSDGDILLILIWAAVCQKPISWACAAKHAPRLWAGWNLPSPSRISRRAQSASVQALLDRAFLELQQRALTAAAVAAPLLGCWIMDAKGLAVNRFSKDRQAKWGYCRDGKARGYKLYLLINAYGLPVDWYVEAMNVAEPTVARRWLKSLDRPGYLLGDSIYDSDRLHQEVAACQVQLLAPRKEPGGPIGIRARSAPRLHAISMLEMPLHTFGPALYAQRTLIERVFSQWSASAVGLDHLPGWVRTLARVRRWVQTKILIALACEN
jgi:hypothetical protein